MVERELNIQDEIKTAKRERNFSYLSAGGVTVFNIANLLQAIYVNESVSPRGDFELERVAGLLVGITATALTWRIAECENNFLKKLRKQEAEAWKEAVYRAL